MTTDLMSMCATKVKRELESRFSVSVTHLDDGVTYIDIQADDEHTATIRLSTTDDGEIRVNVDGGQDKATRIRYRTSDMVTLYDVLLTVINLALVNW